MRLRIFTFLLLLPLLGFCQDEQRVGGFHFGPKAGITIGLQNWDGAERRPMANYHFAVFTESLDPYYKGALYMQFGLMSRGSGLNIFNLNQGFNTNQAFVFRNISLGLGAKKRLLTETASTPYYFVGARIEYQMSNNLLEVQERYFGGTASLFYPIPEFVNDWTYGISFGGGIEFVGSEFITPAIEVSIHPDLSFQYRSPAIPNVVNPFNGQPTSLPERNIRNITLEVSLVIRFLREVIYTN